MAENVVIRGDLIEFKSTSRCEECQNRNRDCIMKMNADACLLCSDSGRTCVFERTVRIRGSAAELSKDVLLASDLEPRTRDSRQNIIK